MATHLIPADSSWSLALSKAIRNGKPGDVIVVNTDIKRQLAVQAMGRLSITYLEVKVEAPV